MKKTTMMLGVLAASAAAGLLGSPALAGSDAGAAKACYRTHCGKSIPSFEGQCGGTVVDQIKDPQACEKAGGAWTTAADAEKFKKDE